jgi:hypothetical protein
MKRLLFVLSLLLISPAIAQQSPDPAFLQAAVTALQAQRNAANDNAAALEAKLNIATADLAKANARIKELEPKEPAK